jgi:anti-sigma factor RsiW
VNRLMLEHCGCEEIRDRLSEYIDEELGALDRARVVLHMAACTRCRETAVGLARTVQVVHRLLGCSGCRPVHRLH